DDVGYHFMVHPGGTIYEGRKLYFKGEHVAKANTGKLGILVMGNFEPLLFNIGAGDPTVNQMSAVKTLGAALKTLFPGIATLAGHRDFNAVMGKKTECPGDKLYARLDEFRTALALKTP